MPHCTKIHHLFVVVFTLIADICINGKKLKLKQDTPQGFVFVCSLIACISLKEKTTLNF